MKAVQDYEPFGSLLPGRNYSSSSYRYGLNGQEKDDEIYGASGTSYTAEFWQYDTRTGRRWNLDPKPQIAMSDYACFGNNPVLISDPFGDEIHITQSDKKGNKQTLKYEQGKLFNLDGSNYEGKIKGFLKQTTKALGKMERAESGREMVGVLTQSSHVFEIVEGPTSRFEPSSPHRAHGQQWATDPDQAPMYEVMTARGMDFSGGSGGTVYFNPRRNYENAVWEQGRNQEVARPAIALAHEMFHALDSDRGLLDTRDHLTVRRSEWQAVYHENILRRQLGLPLRTHYRTAIEERTGRKSPSGPVFIDGSGNPIRPDWYK